MKAGVLRRPAELLRRMDHAIARRRDRRTVLVDARTPVNYTVVAPVHRAMAGDTRVSFFFTASEEPWRLREIYREALSSRPARAGQGLTGQPGVRLVTPRRAAFMRFDAYVASDFTWQPLPRGTFRIQMFHGVGGKYGFDAPDRSMRDWHRFFFVNERRLRNFLRAGALEPGSDAIRLVGMPKVDQLVNGAWDRPAVLAPLGLDPSRLTVLYAPTWSPASSLNAIGTELIRALLGTGLNLIVKLHDRSLDTRERYSGGVDWIRRLGPLLKGRRGAIATGHDISPYLVASDVMITDHSSAGFEYLLLDRPIVRIHRPELISLANIHADYVDLLASVSDSVAGARDAVRATERALASPADQSATRRAVASDLFYKPGGATARAVGYLYEALELQPALAARQAGDTALALNDTLAEGASCRP